MTTELDRQHYGEAALTDPLSGEIVDCSKLEEAVPFIEGLRQMKATIDQRIKEATAFAAEELGRRGTNKLRVAGYDAERTADRKTTWLDVEELEAELADAGAPNEVLDELVETVVERRVNTTAANRIARANPAYGEILDRHRKVQDNGWKLSTKPAKHS
jgi:hypothetical protein